MNTLRIIDHLARLSFSLSLHAKSVKITLVSVRRELVLSTLVINVESDRCEDDEPNQSKIDKRASRSFLAINVTPSKVEFYLSLVAREQICCRRLLR